MRRTLYLMFALAVSLAAQPAHAKLALVFDDPSTENPDLVVEDNGPLDNHKWTGDMEFCQPAGAGSTCANGAAFAANMFGVSEDTGDCAVEFQCLSAWPIEDGSFECLNADGDLVIGQFDSVNSASGLAFKERGGANDYCVSTWSASPDN